MPLNDMTADALNAYEPQRSNNALLYITGVPNIQIIELSIQQFNVPKRTMGKIELAYLNEKRKYAGVPEYDDLTCSFKDLVNADTAAAIYAWTQLVHDDIKGTTGLKTKYAKDGYIRFFGPDGDAQWDRDWDLFGIWPMSMDPSDIDMTSDQQVLLSVQFSVDKAIPGQGYNQYVAN